MLITISFSLIINFFINIRLINLRDKQLNSMFAKNVSLYEIPLLQTLTNLLLTKKKYFIELALLFSETMEVNISDKYTVINLNI